MYVIQRLTPSVRQ